jgi:SprB repeat
LVKDANACSISKSITITQPAIVPVTATSTAGNISCNGGNTTVTVSATGGTAPYTGTGNFTVTAGTYNYTVTDAKGLTATTSIIVSQPSLLNATITAGTIAINGGSTSVTVAAAGGTSPYSYNINGGVFQTSNTFNNLLAGTYTILVKDANACSISKSITITQPAIVPLSANSTAGTISCNGGNTSITVSATGGTAPYTGTGNFTVTAGTYNYTVTDAKGLTANTSIIVSQPSLISASLIAGTITINGGTTSVTVTAAGGTSPYSYNINSGVFQTTNTFNNLLAGTYSIVVKDARGCNINKTITIAQPDSAATRDRFKIRVYPNPSTNYFTLNIRYHHGGTEKVQLIVRDVKGSIVYTASGNIDTQFKFGSNFIPGTYFGNVYIEGTKNYIKLIKTN